MSFHNVSKKKNVLGSTFGRFVLIWGTMSASAKHIPKALWHGTDRRSIFWKLPQIVHFHPSAKCKKQDLRFNTLLAKTISMDAVRRVYTFLHLHSLSLGYKRSKNIFFLELYLYIINFSSLVTCWAKILIQFEDSVKHNLVWFNLLLIPNVNLFRYWNSRKHTAFESSQTKTVRTGPSFKWFQRHIDHCTGVQGCNILKYHNPKL